jgi:hypothetical protein
MVLATIWAVFQQTHPVALADSGVALFSLMLTNCFFPKFLFAFFLSPWLDRRTGLPDGKFSNQKSQFGDILEGLGMVNVAIFYGPLVYLMFNWYILWSFGIFYGHLEYLTVTWDMAWQFGILCGHLVYFVVIWHISYSFGIFCGHFVCIFCGHIVYFVVIW